MKKIDAVKSIIKNRKPLLHALLLGIILLHFSGCSKKEDPAPAQPDGKVSFWNYVGDQYGNVVVTINGSSQTITKDSPTTSIAECGLAGNANFTLPAGTYNYTAAEVGGSGKWSGSATITSGGCLKFRLRK